MRSWSIITFQRRLGLRPVVVTSPKHGMGGKGVEVRDGIEHYRTRAVAGPPFVRELALMCRLAGQLTRVCRLEPVDLIHAHSPVLTGLPALWVGRRLGVPVVYESRAFWEDAAVDSGSYGKGSLRYRIVRALETFLFRRVDAAVTICEAMRRDLLGRGVPAARLHVVPNGVDVEWFRPSPYPSAERERLGLNEGLVFGFIGSFNRYEGLRFLLDTAPDLARRIPGARVLLVGSGPEEAALRAESRRLSGMVLMPGRVAHERVRGVYEALDVFVCPRLSSRLTELVTPLKPLEAMAMERPVLASDVGGLAELVQPGVTGLLFRSGSREDFLDQAVRAGHDHALRRRLGIAARAHLVEERSWASIVARYPGIYASAA
jgi:PEP-CTERM/exosortase A-associated glycosyltransferase